MNRKYLWAWLLARSWWVLGVIVAMISIWRGVTR